MSWRIGEAGEDVGARAGSVMLVLSPADRARGRDGDGRRATTLEGHWRKGRGALQARRTGRERGVLATNLLDAVRVSATSDLPVAGNAPVTREDALLRLLTGFGRVEVDAKAPSVVVALCGRSVKSWMIKLERSRTVMISMRSPG